MINSNRRSSFFGLVYVAGGFLLATYIWILVGRVEASGGFVIPPTIVQTNQSNTWTVGTQDMSGVAHTAPMKVVANVPALPATGCQVGEVAIVSSATLGQQMYQNSGAGACVWTQQVNTGSSSGGGFGGYSSAAAVAFSGTQFFPVVGGGAPSGTETNVDVDSPAAATMKNLFVQLVSAPGMGNSITLTIRQNAADTSLTCAISGAVATSCSDTTHSFNVSQGDLLTLKAVTSGVIVGSINLTFTYQFGNITATGSVNAGTLGQATYYAAGGSAVSGVSLTGLANFRAGVGAPIAAVSGDVTGLFSGGAGCVGTNLLAANGTCQSPGTSTTLSGFYATTDSTNFFGPIFALTKPSAVTFAWRNQGGASETATGGGALYLLAPAGSGNNMRIREITAPATPYTIDTAYLLHQFLVNFNSCGPVFVDSVGGKLVSFIATDASAGGGISIQVNYMTNVTTFSSTPVAAAFISTNGPVWLKVTDDGTNLIFNWSSDGQNYYTYATLGRHAFLAAGPDRVGYHCDSNNATYPASTTLIHWKQS